MAGKWRRGGKGCGCEGCGGGFGDGGGGAQGIIYKASSGRTREFGVENAVGFGGGQRSSILEDVRRAAQELGAPREARRESEMGKVLPARF